MTEDKWYCRCGQVNNSCIINCVNCATSSSEGSNKPFSDDEVDDFAFSVSQRTQNLLPFPIRKVKVKITSHRMIISESKMRSWGAMLLSSLSGIVFFTFLYHSGILDSKFSFIIVLLISFSLPIFLAVFITFPNVRMVVNKNTYLCTIQKRFLFFPFWQKVFSLKDYYFTESIQEYERKGGGNISAGKSIFSGSMTRFLLGHNAAPFHYYFRDRITWTESCPAIGIQTSPKHETLNILPVKGSIEPVLSALTNFIPERTKFDS